MTAIGVGVRRSHDEGEEIVLPRWQMRVTLRAEETAGVMTLVDNVMQPGHLGPPQHVHDGHDEAFLLTSGRLRFRLGDEFVTGEPGQVVYAGRGLAHGFANPFDEPAVWVLALTPSGYERYFRALAAVYADRGELPVGAELAELMAEQSTRTVDVFDDSGHR
ncbi:MAG: cupin domain-containing protein [Phycicoccus sp.]